jgi:hypothetical protein
MFNIHTTSNHSDLFITRPIFKKFRRLGLGSNKELYQALLDGTPKEIEELLKDPNIDPSTLDNCIFCTKNKCNIENIKVLLTDKRVNLYANNAYALELSIICKHRDLTILLMENMYGDGYLYGAIYSAIYKDEDLFKVCYEKGHFNSYYTGIMLEYICYNPKLVEFVLNKSTIKSDKIHTSAIEISAKNNYRKSFEILLFDKRIVSIGFIGNNIEKHRTPMNIKIQHEFKFHTI